MQCDNLLYYSSFTLFTAVQCDNLLYYSIFSLFTAVQCDNPLYYSNLTLFTAVQCEKPPQGTDLCNHVLAQDCTTFETEVVCGSDGVTYHNRSVYKLLHNPQCEYECHISVLNVGGFSLKNSWSITSKGYCFSLLFITKVLKFIAIYDIWWKYEYLFLKKSDQTLLNERINNQNPSGDFIKLWFLKPFITFSFIYICTWIWKEWFICYWRGPMN